MGSKRRESRASPSSPTIKWSIAPSPPSNQHSNEQWKDVTKRVAPAVLCIKFIVARPFEDADQGYRTTASAFVVDKKRGIALTNRHCGGKGPATFRLQFLNGEEVPATRIYVDPVHDFAFLMFDPKLIKYMGVVEIELDPQGAKPGVEVMVIGNDSGEKLLPTRGRITGSEYYAMDANTFYNAATMVTAGGSSGSPVVDVRGKAVGLNANGNDGSAGFFPLDKVVHVLNLLKNGFDGNGNYSNVRIPRKTFGASFIYVPMECMKAEEVVTEKDIEFLGREHDDGLFVVDNCTEMCGLEEGDILLEVNNTKINNFVELETITDDMEMDTIKLIAARKDFSKGTMVKLRIEADLEEHFSTDEILEISGSSMYQASHYMEMFHNLEVWSFVIHMPGASLDKQISGKTIVKSVNGNDVEDIFDFVEAVKKVFANKRSLKLDTDDGIKVIGSDFYNWLSLPVLWQREQDSWTWKRESVELIPTTAEFFLNSSCAISNTLHCINEHTTFSLTESIEKNDPYHIQDSTVGVSFRMPSYIANLDNQDDKWVYSTGIVVYQVAKVGIILVTQPSAPVIVGNVHLCFSTKVKIFGNVVSVDKNRGFSLIYYNPNLLGSLKQKIKPAKLSPKPLRKNDTLLFLCHGVNQQKFEPIDSQLKCVDKEYLHDYINAEVDCGNKCTSGVIVDEKYFKVKGLFGMPTNNFKNVQVYPVSSMLKPLELLMKSMLQDPLKRCLDARVPVFHVNMTTITAQDAMNYGVNYKWIKRKLNKPYYERQYLSVEHCLSVSNAGKVMKHEDVILSVNGEDVCCMEDFNMHLFGEKDIAIRVSRQGIELDVWLEREYLCKVEKTRFVFWCGTLVQDTPWDVDFNQGFRPARGVLVHDTFLYDWDTPFLGCSWISEINGMEIEDLDEFIEVTNQFNDGEYITCKMITWEGETVAFTYQMDYLHFSSIEVTFDEKSNLWIQKEISSHKRQ